MYADGAKDNQWVHRPDLQILFIHHKKRVQTEQFAGLRQNNQQGEQNLCPIPDILYPKFLLQQELRNVP